MSAAVIAIGAVSPLGRGTKAFDVTHVGEPAKVAIRVDPALVALGFARPFSARVADEDLSTDTPPGLRTDRASHLLDGALRDALEELGRVRPAFRGERIGVAIGTSSGGMRRAEELFARRLRGEPISPELARASTYFAPFEAVLAEHALSRATRRSQLVTACAASTWAIGLALRWLEDDCVDVALAGGYDALGPFVAAGFESLRATSASTPRPFRTERDGMALGEGAGIVALVRASEVDPASARFFVSGFGASTDAVHITAPDRSGDGLARAARAALADAEIAPGDVEVVSAHATSTPYNDAMESRAIATVFGVEGPVVHPFKAQIGHTLGAAGVLETLALGHALAERVLPAAAGTGTLDPDAPARLLTHAEHAPERARPRALKESAAFGGANAALVVEARPPSPRRRSRRRAYLRGAAHASVSDVDQVARVSGAPADRVARFDELSTLAATSVAKLLAAPESARALRGAGVIVGHALATVDINDRFYARVLSRGPTSAEPRLFPPTSPNLVPGQLAILFGMTGPSAAVTSSLSGSLEALEVAIDLVQAGDAERVLVVALDLVGPASRAILSTGYEDLPLADGAVAALIDAEGRGTLRAAHAPDASLRACGHHALLAHLGLTAEAREVGDLA